MKGITAYNNGLCVQSENQGLGVNFYGVLDDIIELCYMGWLKVSLFKCKWWDVTETGKGINIGQHFTSVNTTRQSCKDEPFTLVCQAVQVFYLKDPCLRRNWHAVHKITNRNVYNIP